MNRLQTELRRLYAPADAAAAADADAEPGGWSLVDADNRVRCAVLEFVAPADAQRVGALWAGVQNDLGLPPPAVAVSGGDALQLWFSLQQPADAARAHALLDGLRRRWLTDVPARRLRGWPGEQDAAEPPRPGRPVGAERWSAFVAPDLAPLFAETPWLEFPPGDDAQATLLGGLASITPAALDAALAELAPAAAARPTAAATGAPTAMSPTAEPPSPSAAPDLAGAPREPHGFLLAVMNDERVPLALRVDAAKALLAHATRSGG